jgi:hypothetical protein
MELSAWRMDATLTNSLESTRAPFVSTPFPKKIQIDDDGPGAILLNFEDYVEEGAARGR